MPDFETEFITQFLRPLVNADGAARLGDDVAVLEGQGTIIATMDTIVEGVHFLPSDPLSDVAWKALAVNVSDITAKGAQPLEALMSVTWPRNSNLEQARSFTAGLGEALSRFGVSLVGGDTVMSTGPLTVTITLTGKCLANGPIRRSGARVGDLLCTIEPESIGLAGRGLNALRSRETSESATQAIRAYRRPEPRPETWSALIAQHATASIDISDGLLLDALRLAEESEMGLEIDLSGIGQKTDLFERLADATAGDDYVPLIAVSSLNDELLAVGFRQVGQVLPPGEKRLLFNGEAVEWPIRPGYTHN